MLAYELEISNSKIIIVIIIIITIVIIITIIFSSYIFMGLS